MKTSSTKTLSYVALATIAIIAMSIPEVALAQNNAQKTNFSSLLSNPLFKNAIDIGLLIFAGWKWFNYFSDFNPDSAFKSIVVPAVITFLAFQWLDVLRWMQLV
jgi:hypothetical protein